MSDLTVEQRLDQIEAAINWQLAYNDALAKAISTLFLKIQPLLPDGESEAAQFTTDLDFVRQLLEQQRNGTGKASTDMDLIRRMNEKRRGE